MNSTPLRFALIGCGRIAERHATHISRFGDLAAVCDIELERAQSLGGEHDAPAFAEVDDLLAHGGFDVASVCTPNGLHADHSIRALRAGYHVLCEKPMALTVADCGRMITAAEKANRRLFVVKQNRFNPPVAAVKEAVDAGRLGRLLSVQVNCFWNRHEQYYQSSDWRGTRALDGGTLFTQFSHFIDIMTWLAGDIVEAQAMAGNQAHGDTIEFEDTGVVALRFRNGALGGLHYTTNAYGGNAEGSLTIFGEKGTVKIGGQYLNELEYQNIEDFAFSGLPESAGPNNYGTYQGSMSNHDKVYENLVAALHGDAAASTVGYEGLKTVEIIEKIYEAAGRAPHREVGQHQGRAVW